MCSPLPPIDVLDRPARRVLTLALFVGVSLGCAAQRPIDAWQREIEHYVHKHGHGNPAALTELAQDPTRRTFDRIGERAGLIAPTRTDARGILVGHRSIDDELWFIYLVGVVQDQGGIVDVGFDRPVVRAIVPLAFTLEPDSAALRWAAGEDHPQTRDRYLTQQRRRWARSHPQRTAETMRYTRFPRPYDRFELLGADRSVIVRHLVSGATWALELR